MWDWLVAPCDGRSVDAARGVVPTTLRYPDHEGETFSVRFSVGHRWKYRPGMEPEEGVLIKWCVFGFMLAEKIVELTCTGFV